MEKITKNTIAKKYNGIIFLELIRPAILYCRYNLIPLQILNSFLYETVTAALIWVKIFQ